MRLMLALPALLLAAPAAAQLRVVAEPPESASTARASVAVYLMNEGAAPAAGVAPDRLEVIARDGSRIAIVPAERAPASIAAGGFARVRYISAGVISVGLPAANAPVVIEALPPATPPPPPEPTPPTPPAAMRTTELPPSQVEPAAPPRETRFDTAGGTSSAFLDRFEPHEPIYAAIGAGDSATKLQVSLGFRPFGGTGALSRLRFAYTQTMFWATDRPSGPFRATTYSPEVYLDLPVARATAVLFGYRHDSNGEGDPTSIDVNRIHAGVRHTLPLGRDWSLTLAPRAWVYVGRRGYTRDVEDYWGWTGLNAAIEQADGLKLALTARGNPGTGRGAAELFASYPVARVLPGVGFYLFGQLFTGYGEALDDYRTRDTHARIGIALTR